MTFINVMVSAQNIPEGRGGAKWAAGSARWSGVAAPIAREAVRKKTPVSTNFGPGGKVRRGGALKASIKDRVSLGGGVAKIEIGTEVGYAKFLLTGTKAHEIRGRGGGSLHYWRPDGSERYTRRVYHPGTKRSAFVKRAMGPVTPGIRASFAEIMRETFGGAP